MNAKVFPLEHELLTVGWNSVELDCVAGTCQGKLKFDILFDEAGQAVAVKQDSIQCTDCSSVIDINPKYRVQ